MNLRGSAFFALALVSAAPLAFAADKPAPAAAPVVVKAPAFNWAGVYIGIQGGYAWGSSEHRFSNGAPTSGYNEQSWLYGAHVGFNHLHGTWMVWGLEADVEKLDLQGSFVNTTGATAVGGSSSNWDASARARVGALITDTTLFYATAGWAFSHYDFTGGPNFGPPPIPCCGYSASVNGFTGGLGFEHAFHPHMTARIELRYTNYRDVTGALPPTFPGVNMTVHSNVTALRAGLTFKL